MRGEPEGLTREEWGRANSSGQLLMNSCLTQSACKKKSPAFLTWTSSSHQHLALLHFTLLHTPYTTNAPTCASSHPHRTHDAHTALSYPHRTRTRSPLGSLHLASLHLTSLLSHTCLFWHGRPGHIHTHKLITSRHFTHHVTSHTTIRSHSE